MDSHLKSISLTVVLCHHGYTHGASLLFQEELCFICQCVSMELYQVFILTPATDFLHCAQEAGITILSPSAREDQYLIALNCFSKLIYLYTTCGWALLHTGILSTHKSMQANDGLDLCTNQGQQLKLMVCKTGDQGIIKSNTTLYD